MGEVGKINMIIHYRKLLRELWDGAEDIVDSNDSDENMQPQDRWLFLAVKYTLNPAHFRKAVLDWFEENKKTFHFSEQGSSLCDKVVMEAVCLLTKSSWEFKDDDVYSECIIYLRMFVTFYSQFQNPKDKRTYVPGNRSRGFDLTRDYNLILLSYPADTPVHPEGVNEKYWEEALNFSSVMIYRLRKDNIIPYISVDHKYMPGVKDSIFKRKYRNGVVSYCPTLTGRGLPVWLAAYNSVTGKYIFVSWLSESIEAGVAIHMGEEDNMKMPTVLSVEKDVQAIAQDLELGAYVVESLIGPVSSIPRTRLMIPDNNDTKKYQKLYNLSPSKFFKVGRFTKFFDEAGEDIRNALIVYIISVAPVNPEVAKIADALLAETEQVK